MIKNDDQRFLAKLSVYYCWIHILNELRLGFEVSSLFKTLVFKTVVTNTDYQLNVWKMNDRIKTLHHLMPPILSYDSYEVKNVIFIPVL